MHIFTSQLTGQTLPYFYEYGLTCLKAHNYMYMLMQSALLWTVLLGMAVNSSL